MHSDLPKVLHEVGAKPILGHVLAAAKALQPSKIIVVYGYGGETVKAQFEGEPIVWVKQAEQLGTGHAVQQALPHLEKGATTLILLGDVPLVDSRDCEKLINKAADTLAILSFIKADPSGYGRLVRDSKAHVSAIVEHKDATETQRQIKEVNTGMMAMPNSLLLQWLAKLSNNNAQGEYYLTDIVAMAVQQGVAVVAEITEDEWSVTGINAKSDLAQIERVYQQRYAEQLLQQGVTLKDPNRIDVRGDLQCGRDVQIDVNCLFEGQVVLGDRVNSTQLRD